MKYDANFLQLAGLHGAGTLLGFGIGTHDALFGVIAAIASIVIFTSFQTTKDKT